MTSLPALFSRATALTVALVLESSILFIRSLIGDVRALRVIRIPSGKP
jgi:hypothetical protein